MSINIYSKLLEVQFNLVAKKDRKNNFGNYKYRSAEDILESLKPLLKDNGLVLIAQDDLSDNILKATYTLIDIDSKESIQTHAYAIVGEHKGMSAEQCVGCASSYARKYALNGLFAIDDAESDPDSKDNRENKEYNPKNDDKKNIESLKRQLSYLMLKLNIPRNEQPMLLEFMGVNVNDSAVLKDFLSMPNLNNQITSAYQRMHEIANDL